MAAECCGMVTPVLKVYQLKEARKRNIETVQPLLKKGILETKLSEEEDNDSGFSNGNGSICSPDLSKNDLATCLATASLKHPAYIKAKIIRNFESSRPGTELSVSHGEIVNLLYREDDKVLVINSQGKKGFIPFHYCSLLHRKIAYTNNNQCIPSKKLTQKPKHQFHDSRPIQDFLTDMDVLNKNTLPHNRHMSNPNSKTRHIGTTRNSKIFSRERSNISSSSEDSDYYREKSDSSREKSGYYREKSEFPDKFTWNRKSQEIFRQRQKLTTSYFRKGDETRMLVMYDFIARDENDISVYKGEVVSVLNRDDDLDWWWVLAQDGYEGFVPRAYLARLSTVSSEGSTPCSTESFSSSSSTSEGSSTQAVRFQDPLCTFHRYEKEEWETDSEQSQDPERFGHPVLDAGAKETEQGEADPRWSTWC